MTDQLKRLNKSLQVSLLRIRGNHPFFGTLALFADFSFNDEVETAATDGKTIWINPNFVEGLNATSFCGLLVHELLHASLMHTQRRRERDPLLWNIAADVVVNGIVRDGTDFTLPAGGVEMSELSHLSVEEIYEQFATGRKPVPLLAMVDLIFSMGNSVIEQEQTAELERHWRSALQQASAVATRVNKGYGKIGFGRNRELLAVLSPSLNWREILWQYLVATPCDFEGFDRRFIWQKLYLDAVAGEEVQVYICIDTSGSITDKVMQEFLSETTAILDAYPHVHGQLFFADAALYGPYDFGRNEEMPSPKGGGGTSFVPFFDWLTINQSADIDPLCVYLTDGYGEFPKMHPDVSVLWVVCPGGLDSQDFPFGNVVRIGV
jgi:predicted metal-dependent peptidase